MTRKDYYSGSMATYYTKKAGADYLGVSRPTFYSMISEGKIKVKQFAGMEFVSESELDKWTASPKKVKGRIKKRLD